MLQISEIVKKTEEMFDLFNEHFYDNEFNLLIGFRCLMHYTIHLLQSLCLFG